MSWKVLLSLPWRVVESEEELGIVNSTKDLIAEHLAPLEADAIVKAVSCHEELVLALGRVLEDGLTIPVVRQAKEALAHAKEP